MPFRLPDNHTETPRTLPRGSGGFSAFITSSLLTTVQAFCRLTRMSSTRNLAEAVALDRLGYPLESWVNDLRDAGQSWQTIARELSDRTDRLIHVSWETLRVWYST